MPDLFGIDIAGIVADSIASAGGVVAGTLTKITAGTRTPGSLTAGTNPTSTVHTFQGFIAKKTTRADVTLVSETMSVATILGASISPAVVPEVGDTILLEGVSWSLVQLLSRDPAEAVYEFKAES